jgi:hypothetical protein
VKKFQGGICYSNSRAREMNAAATALLCSRAGTHPPNKAAWLCFRANGSGSRGVVVGPALLTASLFSPRCAQLHSPTSPTHGRHAQLKRLSDTAVLELTRSLTTLPHRSLPLGCLGRAGYVFDPGMVDHDQAGLASDV